MLFVIESLITNIVNVIRVDLQLICHKCHHLLHQMFILNSATVMEIIKGIIKIIKIVETITHHHRIEINNLEIIHMVQAFKIFSYENVLSVFLSLFVNTCKYGTFYLYYVPTFNKVFIGNMLQNCCLGIQLFEPSRKNIFVSCGILKKE